MAVSPLIFNKEEAAESKPTATKVKTLAVRQMSGDATRSKQDGRKSPEPELSDKLNSDLREKYVKGTVDRALPASRILTLSREEDWRRS